LAQANASPPPTADTAPASPAASPLAAPADNLPPFQCADQSGGGSARAAIVAVRVGQQSGYDRFVIEFSGPVPNYKVQRNASSSFVQDPSGRTVNLNGSAGLRVGLNPASGAGYGQPDGKPTYSGPNDFTPRFLVLREARLLGDFEAVTTWGLGLSNPNCFRAFILDSPSRLVIDVQSV
jgi:hypothetical protein